MVALEDGKFYQYYMDLEQGGECLLPKEFNLNS